MRPFESFTILLVLMLSACASQGPTDASVSCAAAVAGCKKIYGTCVMLRFPRDATCDAACQLDVKKKIKDAGVSVWHEAKRPTPERKGCVGYREDIGGTVQGAQCLALLTGYELRSEECNHNGWAYSVVVP